MRPLNPVENTGVVRLVSGAVFLGSCFIFRYPACVLTAAHVVKGLASQDVYIEFPGSRAAGTAFPAVSIQRHPHADLAILEIAPPNERDVTWAQYLLIDDRSYGTSVATFGYPREWQEGVFNPQPRFFKGHVQRFFEHVSHLGYNYLAAELSFGCPAGLSGAQLFHPELMGRVYGLVTENTKTTTEHESTLEVIDNKKEYKETFYNVINYGTAVWLPGCADWIDSVVPKPSPEELARRTENQHKWAREEQR